MQYPGRTIKEGEADAAIIKSLKERLNAALAADSDPTVFLDPKNGTFGPKMKRAVQLFQARNVDSTGRPLKPDGQIGAFTWAALFGNKTVPRFDTAESKLLTEALAVAGEEAKAKIKEDPKNSNCGTRVEEYLRRVNVPRGNAWCCAFVYWCLDEAAKRKARANPMVKTAGCLDHWNRAPGRGAKRVATANAIEDPSLVKPGMIFIMDYGRGMGHTGLVEKLDGALVHTIEGNTDATKTREGGGVYRLTRRVADINKGFIDYSQA